MSGQTDTNNIGGESPETKAILDRDGWTCQVCGHTPPEGSDEPMFVTQIGEDENDPGHHETRCGDCCGSYHGDETSTTQEQKQESVRRTTYNPDSIGTRLYRTSFAMVVFLPALLLSGASFSATVTILNPLRMTGMSTIPEIHPDTDVISGRQYLYDVVVVAPQTFIMGTVVLLVATQIAIWIEPKGGIITRSSKWVIRRVRR